MTSVIWSYLGTKPCVCLAQVLRIEFLWAGPGCMRQMKPLCARGAAPALSPPWGRGRAVTQPAVSCRALAGVAARWDQHGHGRPGPGARVRPLRESGEGLYLWVPFGLAQACLAGSPRVPLGCWDHTVRCCPQKSPLTSSGKDGSALIIILVCGFQLSLLVSQYTWKKQLKGGGEYTRPQHLSPGRT